MGMRSGTTFKKRQKEIARMEKARDKAARRVQRKAEKLSPGYIGDSGDSDIESETDGEELSMTAGELAGELPPAEPTPAHE